MHKPYYSIFIMIYSNIQEYKVHNNLNLLKLFRRPWLVLFGASVGVWSLHGLDKVVVSGFPGYELKNLQACFWGRVNLWMEFWVSWVYIFQGKAGNKQGYYLTYWIPDIGNIQVWRISKSSHIRLRWIQ